MIFLDSWVWIEYFSEDGKKAEQILKKLDSEGGFISTFVLMEVKYVIQRRFDLEKANLVISIIKSFPDLAIVPVTQEIAERAAELKNKYRSRHNRFSYGDAVMLATAQMTRSVLYTGDGDFVDVEEVDVVVV